METLLHFAAGHGATLEFSYTRTTSEHDTIPPFLEELGFARIDTAETLYALTVGELRESPFFKETTQEGSAALPFEEVPVRALERAYREEAVLDEDYLEHGLTGPEVDAQTSVAVLAGREVRSFMAFTSAGADSLSLAWVKGGEPKDLPLMFRVAFARICEKYPPEASFTVQAVNPSAAALIRAVLPAAVPISYTWVRESLPVREQKEE